MPFLSLGIGIDDMFIFIYTLVSDPSILLRRQAAHRSSNKCFLCGELRFHAHDVHPVPQHVGLCFRSSSPSIDRSIDRSIPCLALSVYAYVLNRCTRRTLPETLAGVSRRRLSMLARRSPSPPSLSQAASSLRQRCVWCGVVFVSLLWYSPMLTINRICLVHIAFLRHFMVAFIHSTFIVCMLSIPWRA